MGQAKTERSEFSPDDWRGLAKHLRELALGVMDDKTRARMNRQAQDYERTADQLEEKGFVPVPPQGPVGPEWVPGVAFSSAPPQKLRLFRRMLAWRPRAVGRK